MTGVFRAVLRDLTICVYVCEHVGCKCWVGSESWEMAEGRRVLHAVFHARMAKIPALI